VFIMAIFVRNVGTCNTSFPPIIVGSLRTFWDLMRLGGMKLVMLSSIKQELKLSTGVVRLTLAIDLSH
jgi:hypothetical protein